MISDNTITGWGINSTSSAALSVGGIEVDAASSVSTLGTVTLSNNKIHDINGACITFPTGAYNTLNVESNDISNCGAQSSSAPAISFTGTSASSTYIENNIAYNSVPNSTVTGTVNYGFSATAGTLYNLNIGQNDFSKVATSPITLSGATVSSLTGSLNPEGVGIATSTTGGAILSVLQGSDNGAHAQGDVVAVASSTNGTISNLLRLRSDGSLNIGTTAYPAFAAGTTGNLNVQGQTELQNNLWFINANQGIFFNALNSFQGAINRATTSNNIVFAGYNLFTSNQDVTVLTPNGNWGMGSSTPFAKLTVQANSGDTNSLVFSIASSTATATTSLFSVTNTGHIIASSTNPTISSCGTGPTMKGDDTHGHVTEGSGASTGCVVTFQVPYTVAPVCTVSPESGSITTPFNYTLSTSAITISDSALSSDVFDYICVGLTGS